MLILDAVSVREQKAASFPFNLEFKTKLKGPQVQGPGVYVINFDQRPVYFGKFQPWQRNNIFNDRWLRHLETFTLRGTRVGFGKNSTFEKVSSTVSMDVTQLLNNLSNVEKEKRFSDTGVVSSVARRSFACEHWDYFSKATADNILDRFALHFFKLNGTKNELQAKLETSRIENQMIHAFNFRLNSSWGEKQDFTMVDVTEMLTTTTNDSPFELQLCLKIHGPAV
jgi:hypothetical protein